MHWPSFLAGVAFAALSFAGLLAAAAFLGVRRRTPVVGRRDGVTGTVPYLDWDLRPRGAEFDGGRRVRTQWGDH